MSERSIVDDTDGGRFELRVGQDVAGYAQYREGRGGLALTHTVVEQRYEGQGIGSALARGALDAARERDLPVLPYCPFIRSWIAKHPDYLDLVPADRREEFGLPPGEPAPGGP